MGSKGQSTSTTNQNQTYAPAGAGYVQNALNQGQAAANLPFNIPVAPVAGFSQDQQNAFNTVNNAQGMAQPYFNQAQQYFSPQGAQQFFNPYASAVSSQMQNIFGQQNQQNNANLAQSAGGVGADRIAVGQGELANQQSLAAGQTFANLYGQAQSQANAAGQNYANLGTMAQNAALTGAQAQLGTGGLQQQLAQAQLNAPYQQQLAAAAFPYQQAQFNAGITSALAPGLGGTTYGTGTTNSTPAQPSIWSQLLGAGTAAAGIYGGFGGGKGSASYGGGNAFSGDAYGGSSTNPLPGLTAADYGPGYADGGDVENEGGGGLFNLPSGFNDKPINVAPQSVIPNSQVHPIQTQQPSLNLSAPTQQQQSSSSGGIGDVLASAGKLAMMFANRGGSVNPYAMGGRAFADGGDTDVINPDEPFRMPDQASVDAWRNDTPVQPLALAGGDEPSPAVKAVSKAAKKSNPYTEPQSAKAPATVEAPAPAAADDDGMSFADFGKSPWAALTAAGLGMMAGTSPYAGVNIGQGGLQGLKTLQTQRETAQKDTTIEQSAKRLEQEAKFHEDQFNRKTMGQQIQEQIANRPYNQVTAYQQAELDAQEEKQKLSREQFNRPYEELTKAEQARIDQQNRPYQELTKAEQAQLEESRRQHDLARVPQGFRQKEDGSLEPVPGGPHSPEQIQAEVKAKQMPGMDDETLKPMVESYIAGNTGVLSQVGRGAQGAANLNRFWALTAQALRDQGADGKTLAASRANFLAQSAGARVAATREAQIDTAVNEARKTFPLLEQASAKLPRTNWTPINEVISSYRNKSGNPDQRALGAALQASITAYSQAMSRTGANSVWAQQHAENLLNAADGHTALLATIKQLDAEMQIAQSAPEETRQAILERILNPNANTKQQGATPPAAPPAAAQQPQQGPPPAPPRVKVSSPEEAQKLAPGTKYETPDGAMYTR